MPWRLRAASAAMLIAAWGLFTWPTEGRSQPQEQTQPFGTQSGASDQQQRAAQQPIVVNVLPTQKTEQEAAEDRRDRQEKAELDRRAVDLTAELAHFTDGLYRATVVLAVATIFLVVATCGLGYFAF